jgi:ribonuclease VapC
MSQSIDASAVLAVVLGEPGSDNVAAQLEGSIISAVNLSEIYRKLVDGEIPIGDAILEVGRFRLKSVPFDDEAARLRPLTKHLGLSLADRACIGLAIISNLPLLTADRRMADAKDILAIDIRMIR